MNQNSIEKSSECERGKTKCARKKFERYFRSMSISFLVQDSKSDEENAVLLILSSICDCLANFSKRLAEKEPNDNCKKEKK